MIVVNTWLHKEQTRTYRCYDFVREVWAATFGVDIGQRDYRSIRTAGFKEIEQPIDPCFVVMQRWRLVPHIGIYTDGNVLHLTPSGVKFEPLRLAARVHQKVSFYK